ncbi:hypothetical protein J3R30DRAFT_3710822 [Lentinula aciculospora]|uniref:Uncharacterized protein n=1 Tax=Lentinula aciculospora TaxID=153920 RepID=A0A9W9A0J0_9AGAR|nr:hypothetical protein J3R30DRAFT_3710822 [Lentinula aciculospora]
MTSSCTATLPSYTGAVPTANPPLDPLTFFSSITIHGLSSSKGSSLIHLTRGQSFPAKRYVTDFKATGLEDDSHHWGAISSLVGRLHADLEITEQLSEGRIGMVFAARLISLRQSVHEETVLAHSLLLLSQFCVNCQRRKAGDVQLDAWSSASIKPEQPSYTPENEEPHLKHWRSRPDRSPIVGDLVTERLGAHLPTKLPADSEMGSNELSKKVEAEILMLLDDLNAVGSPENRRTPQPSPHGGPIPFQLNIPQNYVPSQHSQDDLFQVINHNGQEFQLTQGIANQLRNLPPLLPTRGHGCGRTSNQAVSLHNQNQNAHAGPSNLAYQNQFPHLPAELQAQLAFVQPHPARPTLRQNHRRAQSHIQSISFNPERLTHEHENNDPPQDDFENSQRLPPGPGYLTPEGHDMHQQHEQLQNVMHNSQEVHEQHLQQQEIDVGDHEHQNDAPDEPIPIGLQPIEK